jgi:hypothetical protein
MTIQAKVEGAFEMHPDMQMINAAIHHSYQCDRVFPCQTCCKRGVADICPQYVVSHQRCSLFIEMKSNSEALWHPDKEAGMISGTLTYN